MPQSAKLRKREIGFAVAMGALAAGAGGLWIAESREDPILAVATAGHQTYAVAPFDRISTVGPQDVIVTQGDTLSVRSDGNPAALARLEVVVDGTELKIQPKDGVGSSWGRLSGAVFHITVPRLSAIAVAGSGSVRLDRAEGERFAGSVVGPGELTIGALKVDQAEFDLAGSGNLIAAGTAGETRVNIAGSGEVEGRSLTSATASISIGGSGDAALKVERSARVAIMGSGDVEIIGGAKCSVSKMGSGDVRCNGEEVER